ncbi:Hypothetical protein POVR1_LOCUS470 [uncultured virus]|nr:Hypothetical protein POVR1_LOCUS470 [uncultured virus]
MKPSDDKISEPKDFNNHGEFPLTGFACQFGKYNKNGMKICDVPFCRKRSGLKQVNDSFYCGKHEKNGNIRLPPEIMTRFKPRNMLTGERCCIEKCTNKFLIEVDTINYCYEHFTAQQTHNQCLERCEAVGCNKSSKLIYKFGGLFCHRHLEILGEIRKNKSLTLPVDQEISWRSKELALRKFPDYGHAMYIHKLLQIWNHLRSQ